MGATVGHSARLLRLTACSLRPAIASARRAHMRMGFALLKREKFLEGLAIFERVLREQ